MDFLVYLNLTAQVVKLGRIFVGFFFFCCQPWPMKETTFYTKEENYIKISENPHKIYR